MDIQVWTNHNTKAGTNMDTPPRRLSEPLFRAPPFLGWVFSFFALSFSRPDTYLPHSLLLFSYPHFSPFSIPEKINKKLVGSKYIHKVGQTLTFDKMILTLLPLLPTNSPAPQSHLLTIPSSPT